jgi:CubicO group peptidase (beta-lactamase class C family)
MEYPMIRTCFSRSFGLLCATLLLGASGVQGQIDDRATLVSALDSAAAAHVEHDYVAGVSVAVVRGADTLLMKGYGYADLEWSVPTPADARASYEIGSVTKQFTSAAVMLLVEQGELDLDADMTEYLPDFDTQGHAVPVRRLLDHTSGIKGYTEMAVFGELVPKRLPRDTLVSLVEAEPFEFEPGTALIYNNSAYFLLGLIIEEVSGQSYEDFVEEHLFDRLGMEGSYYCSTSGLRDNRAHGYDGSPDGLVRKGFLDHTWPYAAGSLCSTAPDLIRWNQALHGGEVVSPSSYSAMTTPMPLENGTPTRYAMALGVTGEGARRSIAHGGGINGFLSDGRYYPQDDLIIVVLQNSTGPQGPGGLSAAFADLILGPAPEPTPVTFSGDLSDFVGTYEGPARGRPLTITVSMEDGGLAVAQGSSEDTSQLVYIGDGTWLQGSSRVSFAWEGGVVTAIQIDQVGGLYVLPRQGAG